MSGDLLYESLIHLFGGHIAGIISNGAHYSAGSSSGMSLNESIYNHVPRENKKTYMYNGGGETHFDSYRKNSESIYPVISLNPARVALHFSDLVTHTAGAGM